MRRTLFFASLLLMVSLAYALGSTPDVLPIDRGGILQAASMAGASTTLRGPRIQLANSYDEFFYLRRHTAPPNDPTFNYAEYYLSSGAIGDTFAVYLKPIMPCSLMFVQEGWYNAGTVEAYLWEPNPEWLAAYPTGRACLPDEGRGQVSLSPIGDVIAGPVQSVSDGYGFGYLFDSHTIDSLKIFRGPRTGLDFVAGWVKTTEDQLPQPLSDDVSGRGYCYTWFGGPWTTSDPDDGSIWGMYSSGLELDVILEVAVLYIPGTPPIIEDLSQIPNTINGSKVNPISVTIQDPLSGWTEEDHAWLVWEGPDAIDSVEIFDEDKNNEFVGAISDLRLRIGDEVRYWVTCRDEQWNYNTTAEAKKSFKIVPPPTTQTILWIDDASLGGYDYNDNKSTRNFSLMYAMVDGYTTSSWVEDVVFHDVYYWEPNVNHGLDSFLIDAVDWDLILYTGGGGKYMPMYASDDNPFADYIANGGDIFLASPDYYFNHGISSDAPIEFAADDFAYDVFGLVGGYSDPPAPDSVYTGTSGKLTDMFVDAPFEIFPLYLNEEGFGGNTSMDYIYPIDADNENLLIGEHDGKIYGVQNTTSSGGSAIFLSFDMSQASKYSDPVNRNLAPTQQLIDFTLAVITAFVPTAAAPEPGISTPAVFSLKSNYPNPFNPATRISFDVPRTGDVTLEVFNMIGQRVALLQQGVLAPGSYTRTFNGSGLASGTYLCRMSAPGYTQTRKLVLVK